MILFIEVIVSLKNADRSWDQLFNMVLSILKQGILINVYEQARNILIVNKFIQSIKQTA